MVTLKVGEEEKAFAVHKKLLCEKIPYFEKMFCGPWVEASKNLATFPDDKVEAFDVLVGWLYSGKLRSTEPQSRVEAILMLRRPFTIIDSNKRKDQ
jgi:hypothetical protein